MEPRHSKQLLENTPVWNRHTVSNCYRIHRYGTDIQYATVTEYTGMEPTYLMQLLANIPVWNRHRVSNC